MRGSVAERYVDEPEYVPPPVCAEESMVERWPVEPEWFVDRKSQVGASAPGPWILGGVDSGNAETEATAEEVSNSLARRDPAERR